MKLRRNIKWLCGAFFIAFVLSWHVDAQIIINEVSASNSSTLLDEDGDASDWIELKNTSENSIVLSDFYISDSSNEPLLFQLPDITLQPGDYSILFASDKNRPGGQIIWDTSVRKDDQIKYIIPTSAISNNWIANDFDDSNWQTGNFGIGYGDNDDQTQVSNGTLSIFTRTTFNIEDIETVRKIFFNIDFDDAYIAYINGVEVKRENIDGDSPAPYNQQANNYTEPRLVFGQELPRFILNDFIDVLVEGENTLAIQLHNFNSGSSDLTLIPFLSIGYSQEPSNSRGASAETGLTSQEFNFPHLNFKLSSSGETVYLNNASEVTIDSLPFPELSADESFGRSLSGDELFIFTTPTPGTNNTTDGFTSRSADPLLSMKGGFFNEDVSISLINSDVGNITYFTDDGSVPTQSDQVFGTGTRVIDETKTLKFRTFEPGGIPSDVVVETYFVNDFHDLPVVTISTHPDNLWSDENGIYVVGTNGIPGNGHDGANWNQDWEKPVHFELFEEDGSKAFGIGAGTKIFGGWSRLNPAKSLSVFFRGEYGVSALDYKMFDAKDIDSFQAIVLRNSGNDFSSQGHSMFRDGLMINLAYGTEIDFQAFRPSVLYLNGEYWGIHNIREKVNEHFIEANNGVDADNIDLLQAAAGSSGAAAIHGSVESYAELISFVTFTDLRNAESYAQAEELIDMDNYIDYMATQIYYANTDWPGNNAKWWRSREAGGKWRWIMYDTDFGFALPYGGQVWHNTLNFALEPSGPGWPNPPWSTLLFRELTESKIFRDKFALRMADLMSYNFKPARVVAMIDSLAGLIESEIPRHMTNNTRSGYWGGSEDEWNNQIQILKDFALNRPNYIEEFFTQSLNSGGNYGIGELSSLSVYVSNNDHGRVKVNRLVLDTASWQGQYFRGIDIPLTAIPKAGYEFSRWTGDVSSEERQINVRAGLRVTAQFVPSSSEQSLVINEIMYNSDESQESDDWIELHNPSDSAFNIAGWILKDEDDSHEYIIPEGTVVDSGGYVVLAKDLNQFEAVYPNIETTIGEIGFGFSGNSDQVRLFNASGILVDSVLYDDKSPWPIEADGNGYSLELINADSDNELASSWRASTHYLGSPGLENGSSVSNSEENDVPKLIELFQNYPNPFNPSTTISFSIPKSSNIRLQVYSITGQLVGNLMDEFVQTGKYSVKWDASNQASGVYFYVLNVDADTFSKKMVLIK